MNILCVIPARGGSRGIPQKNVAMLAGKPLLVHSVNHARECLGIQHTIVSTDDEVIASVAENCGASVIMRPPEISGDYSPSEDAIKHVLANLHYRPNIIVFLQATSPLRTARHIEQALRTVTVEGYDSVLSAVRLHQFVWRDTGGGAYSLNYNPTSQRPMRQSVSEWVENGSIYCFKTEILERYGTRLGGKIGIVEMPYWSRFEIDTPEDLAFCEWIMAEGLVK